MSLIDTLRLPISRERRRFFEKITGKTPLPSWLSIELNYDCPSRCKTCILWTRHFRDARIGNRKKLPVSEWKTIIHRIADAGIRSVTFVGGEPFAYPGLFDVLETLKARNIAADIFTNGLLITREIAEKIIQSGIRSLTFSIDGSQAGVHDAVRAIPGSFDKSVSAIAIIQDLKEKRGVSLPGICVNTTVSSMNIHDIAEMSRFAATAGANCISFHIFSIVKESLMAATNAMLGENAVTVHSYSHLPEQLMLSEDELDVFMQIAKKTGPRSNGIAHVFDNMVPKTPKKMLVRGLFAIKRCNFFWNSLAISPFGEVMSCPMIPEYIMGNITTHSLEEIWNNEKYKRLRNLFRKKLLPICANCCFRS